VIPHAALLISLLQAVLPLQREVWMRFADCGLIVTAYAVQTSYIAEMRLKCAAWKYYRTTYNGTTGEPCQVKVCLQTLCDLLQSSMLDVRDCVRLYMHGVSAQLHVVVEGMCAVLPIVRDQSFARSARAQPPVLSYRISFKVQCVELRRMLAQVRIVSNACYVNLREYDGDWYLTLDSQRDPVSSRALGESGRVTAHTIALALTNQLQPYATQQVMLYLRVECIAAMLEKLHAYEYTTVYITTDGRMHLNWSASDIGGLHVVCPK
tara:strand:- start:167 stop:961 length:795 start_codon:yes stop_codon:yes gene_type:complete